MYSFVRISRLSGAEVEMLGNNIAPRSARCLRTELAAVNRSLAVVGEAVERLHRTGAKTRVPIAKSRAAEVHDG